jgi:membrane fusion protein, multidrug efflux system
MKGRARLLPLLLLLACSEPTAQADLDAPAENAAAPAAAPEAVEVERIGLARLRATIAASGTIEAKRITEIGSEVPGRIVAVLVNVGDSVEAGAPLFQIDPGPYRMALAEAEAGLRLARANSANAAEEAERLRTLLARNAASQQRYDQLRTQAEVARAQVAQMEARVEKAQRDLAQTEVRSPYAASVVERRAHEGAMAGAGAILVVQERGALEGILNVPEATPVAVRPGDAVRLFVEGLPDPIEARVGSVSARVDPGTRTYEVRVPVTDASGQLKAGSYARAELAVSRAEERPVAHRSSVLTRDGRSFVLVVADGVVRYAPVRVGVSEGEQVEILGGALPGALVVRGEATGRLADGARVTPSQSGAQAANDLPGPPP